MSIKNENGWGRHNEDVIPAATSETITGTVVNCDAVNVRSKPSLDSPVLAVLGKGVEVAVLSSEDPKFYSVKTNDGIEGHIMKDFLKSSYR